MDKKLMGLFNSEWKIARDISVNKTQFIFSGLITSEKDGLS